MKQKHTIDITFLGVGSAGQEGLGHASAVIQLHGRHLLIDCGPGTIQLFRARYGKLPDAVFITHCHLDHVGDFEALFIQSWFHQPVRHQPKVFVPADIVALLNKRVGSYPAVLAEGGVNFWEAFQLVPVNQNFIFEGLNFEVIPVRHHAPGTAFGLRLPGAFLYSGDTRPIPEVIAHTLGEGETIFHDCGVTGNPSHTGIDDLLREYPAAWRQRIYCYHYASAADADAYKDAKLKLLAQGDSFSFDLDT